MVKFGKLMLVVILIMFVGTGICLYILSELDERISYEISEKNTITFLNDNIDELNDLAQDYLNNPDLESKEYKLISFISYNNSDDRI